ncbi:putative nuclease of restriction endonuclease-like (RecB) superfamily [Spirosoma oryzae]|uniref:Putative nuclease of restriction endonuclease-like (RecB) superfamily n=1 Tax=Spirosoma oryzae TaxID=1469603 RepID=A0A2T0SNT4_9BACT|nr:PDDEXK nuclease domain-containing protein [Spirosoma oryzae]PRY35077.1 putative nuclease of restriction endonuclease-like (RecB) superfamily [Spirosoma oryzae]
MDSLLSSIRHIILQSRQSAVRSVNHALTLMYWHIGQAIVEDEQQGHQRAVYGKALIKTLSETLVAEYGENFSGRNLQLSRQLYLTFPNVNALSSHLSWTHYKALMRLGGTDQRTFYGAETEKNGWTVRQLERQINSQLYERLLLSQDKESVLAIARSESKPTEPHQLIKDPLVLEFLGLKPQASYYEYDLENAIITHIQEFLLELGNGFSFVARQKRIYIEGDEFKVDLVFYNRLLQCFVLLELKLDKITHQDLGQLQMYVNYYDRSVRESYENPTIGILLCADKNDAVVRYTLPENNTQLFASKYQLHLPTEQQFIDEILRELPDQRKDST